MDSERPSNSAAVAEDSESRVIPLRPEYADGGGSLALGHGALAP